MKEFSKKWKGSKIPKKQRKFLAKAPLHIKRKLLSTNLSKELREKQGMRSAVLRKGDSVKVTSGKFKGKKGKITKIKTKQLKVYMEGIQRKKQDGSVAEIPLRVANLQIVELDMNDKRRFKKSKKSVETQTTKKEELSKVKEKEKNKQ
ncbi:MAG: 50S ribosomal protein L24 [Nanoarchaeota archaeon]|nr:50S ribosomal protein L24 [Nanoarchaeota archaeon]